MNQNEPTDHWAILAAELGAQPASEPPSDKPADQATSPEAPAQQPEAAVSSRTAGISAPPGTAGDSEAQAALRSSSLSTGLGEEPPQPAGPRAAERPAASAAQTKSSWDILAEQLGIAAEQAVERAQSDADAVGLADSAQQAAASSGVSTAQRAELHRPSGSGRRPRQQQPLTRFGEGIFDEEHSAQPVEPAVVAQDVAKSAWQSAEAPQVELSTDEAEGVEIAGQDVATSDPKVTASAQRAAEGRTGRRRRKKRRSPETAASGKPQRPSAEAVPLPPVGDGLGAIEAESVARDERHQQVETAGGREQSAPIEQPVTGRTGEQVDLAQQACGTEPTEGYRAPSAQEELAQPPASQELSRQDQSAVAEPAAVVGQAAESAASAREQSSKHRAIPTWAEAISVIINANLEARARRGDAGRDRRERGGR
jgi:hypothetical protein